MIVGQVSFVLDEPILKYGTQIISLSSLCIFLRTYEVSETQPDRGLNGTVLISVAIICGTLIGIACLLNEGAIKVMSIMLHNPTEMTDTFIRILEYLVNLNGG